MFNHFKFNVSGLQGSSWPLHDHPHLNLLCVMLKPLILNKLLSWRCVPWQLEGPWGSSVVLCGPHGWSWLGQRWHETSDQPCNTNTCIQLGTSQGQVTQAHTECKLTLNNSSKMLKYLILINGQNILLQNVCLNKLKTTPMTRTAHTFTDFCSIFSHLLRNQTEVNFVSLSVHPT